MHEQDNDHSKFEGKIVRLSKIETTDNFQKDLGLTYHCFQSLEIEGKLISYEIGTPLFIFQAGGTFVRTSLLESVNEEGIFVTTSDTYMVTVLDNQETEIENPELLSFQS